LLLIALTAGGTRVPWLSSTIFALVLVSLGLSLAFVWWLRLAAEPFLPLTVLGNPVMRAGTAATSWMLGAVLGLTVYMPLYFQVVHGLSATEAGLALIPIVLMTTPGSMLSGRSMMYLRHYKVSAIAGATIAIASVTALAIHPAMPLLGVIIALTLIGFGAGTVYPVATVSIQNAVPAHQVGTATGAMNFFRALASAPAVAIMRAILLPALPQFRPPSLRAGRHAACRPGLASGFSRRRDRRLVQGLARGARALLRAARLRGPRVVARMDSGPPLLR